MSDYFYSLEMIIRHLITWPEMEISKINKVVRMLPFIANEENQ